MAITEKRLLFTLALSILFTVTGQAQTINAPSCNESDVQTALISVTQSSATVNIPAGSCTWTSGITYTVPTGTTSLVIQGAGAKYATTGGASATGTDETIIRVDVSGGNPGLAITVANGQSIRITAIDFTEASGYNPNNGMVAIGGASSSVRIDHCHFQATGGAVLEGVQVNDSIMGVADHDFFDSSNPVSNDIRFYNGTAWEGDPYGAGGKSWADTDHFGSSNFFFAEDDLFTGGAGDCMYGGRYVIRNSTLMNSVMYNHGTNPSGRGCRASEFYHNTVDNTGADPILQGGAATSDNSGPFLVWGNTVSGTRFIVNLDIVRQSNATYPESAPPNGWGYCGNAQTGVTSTWDGNTSAATGYPCLDAPGRGAGDLVTGSAFPGLLNSKTGTPSWPHQVLDPIYAWSNTYSDAGYSPEGIVGISAPGLKDNVDYFMQFGTYGEPGSWNGTAGINQSSVAPSGNCSAGPGGNTPGVGWWDTSNNTLYVCTATNTWTDYYKPYAYPHPLTQNAATVGPPTNVTAIAH